MSELHPFENSAGRIKKFEENSAEKKERNLIAIETVVKAGRKLTFIR